MYKDKGGGFFKPEMVASPKIGELVLIGLAGALKLASALMGIIFFNDGLLIMLMTISFDKD